MLFKLAIVGMPVTLPSFFAEQTANINYLTFF